jgi:hypothetical protein
LLLICHPPHFVLICGPAVHSGWVEVGTVVPYQRAHFGVDLDAIKKGLHPVYTPHGGVRVPPTAQALPARRLPRLGTAHFRRRGERMLFDPM